MLNSFSFVIPAELEKSDDGEWKVKGLASTQSIDQQGELIMQKGIDLSPIDQKRGILNWEHQKGPENTIGVLDGYSQGENGLYIEGRLFKNHSKAKAVREIMASLNKSDKGRIGLSVEGQILERDPSNSNIIKKCRINAVAITMNPVNQNTYADLVKSMNSGDIDFDATDKNIVVHEEVDEAIFTAKQVVQIIEKALSVGTGYVDAPSQLSGGSALAVSDMTSQNDEKEPKDKKKLKKMCKTMYKSNMLGMLETLQVLYPGYSRDQIWSAVKTRVETIFPDINDEYPKN